METNDLSMIVQEVQDRINDNTKKDRIILAALKEDTELFSEEDKREILHLIVDLGFNAKNAISFCLRDRLDKQAKKNIVSELFPDIYEQL